MQRSAFTSSPRGLPVTISSSWPSFAQRTRDQTRSRQGGKKISEMISDRDAENDRGMIVPRILSLIFPLIDIASGIAGGIGDIEIDQAGIEVAFGAMGFDAAHGEAHFLRSLTESHRLIRPAIDEGGGIALLCVLRRSRLLGASGDLQGEQGEQKKRPDHGRAL